MAEARLFPALPAPASRALAEVVADQLRRAILEGRLKPGEHIVEHEIARVMALSRGPVREALKMLRTERLIVQYPHRGAFVAWLSPKDAEEICTLREALETLAFDYALRQATPEQIDELDAIVRRMGQMLETDFSPAEATDIDMEFHHTLCRISGHSRVLANWLTLRPQVRLLIFGHRCLRPQDFRNNGVSWHRDLVEALRRRDAAAGRRAMHLHLMASFETILEAVRLGNVPQAGPEEQAAG